MSYALVMRMHGAGFTATVVLALWFGLLGNLEQSIPAGSEASREYRLSLNETGWMDRYGHWVSNKAGQASKPVVDDRSLITAGISVIEGDRDHAFSDNQNRDGWVKRDNQWIWVTVGDDRLTTSSIADDEPLFQTSVSSSRTVADQSANSRSEIGTRWVKINGSWILQHTFSSVAASVVRSEPLYTRPMSSPRAVGHQVELARRALTKLLDAKKRHFRHVELPVNGSWQKIDGVWNWVSNDDYSDPVITGSLGTYEPRFPRSTDLPQPQESEPERSAVVEGYWHKINGEWRWQAHNGVSETNVSHPQSDPSPRWVLFWRLLNNKIYV